MGERVPLNLNVRGDLDTTMPVTDRPLGGLIRARDVHPQRWGPRAGSQSFTRVWEAPGTAAFYDDIKFNRVVAGAFATAKSYEDQFRDLGTTFTLDIWFRLEDLAYAAAQSLIALYSFTAGSGGTGSINVDIGGGASSDHERIVVTVTPSATRSSSGTARTLTGMTRISSGTTQTDKHHLRVVRDGANLTIYLNGVSDGTLSTLSATQPIYGELSSAGIVSIGASVGYSFVGHIYGAWLRDGAFTSSPIEAVMPCDPWARNVHHAYISHNFALGSVPAMFDSGRFGAHAPIHSGAASDYTITSSNDNAAPAPAIVQGLQTWTTRTNRTATTVAVGGQLSTAIVS